MSKVTDSILAVQYIRMFWNKKHRSAQFATLREKYVLKFELPKGYFEHDRNCGIPIHEVIIQQTDSGLEIKKNGILLNQYDDMVHLGGVDILIIGNYPEIIYRYSTQVCGAPARYDKRYNFLCEKAFDLKEGESGRVIHNGRHSDMDTGEWYYTKDIVNVCLTQEYNENIFIQKPFVNHYEQIAFLK